MADLTTLQHLILTTLNTQSPGYLCSPHASAFVAQGAEDAEMIERELISMEGEGWVEFYKDTVQVTVPKLEKDEEGNPKVNENGTFAVVLDEDDNLETEVVEHLVDQGWIITDKGKEALNV